MAEDLEKLVELLNGEMGLSPYESRAYMAVLLHGPLSPQGVNQRSGVPRPRAYDVLNGLVGKGLLMEQPGRPTVYAAVDPRVGLGKLMLDFEGRMRRQLDEKKRVADRLSLALSKLHVRSQVSVSGEAGAWVTRRDSAFIAKYCEAIRSVERELVVASPEVNPPEGAVLEAIEDVLKKKRTVRVVRQITSRWARDDLDRYEKLILLGDQVRQLKYAGLRFAVFDKKDTVLVLPADRGSHVAVWMSLPSLAEILHGYFVSLWERARPALPVLRRIRGAKVQAQ